MENSMSESETNQYILLRYHKIDYIVYSIKINIYYLYNIYSLSNNNLLKIFNLNTWEKF